MSARIPILFSVRSLGIGGCERDLTKLATSIDRSRFDPHVAYFEEGFQLGELEKAGVPLLPLKVPSFVSRDAVRASREFRRYMKAHRIRISHAYDVPLSIFSAPNARLAGVPLVVTSALGSRRLYAPIYRRALRVADRLSHRILVNSETMRSELAAISPAAAKKSFLCHNGFNPAIFFAPSDGTRVRQPELHDAEVVIGTVCVLREEKNIGLLLEAFASLQRPGIRLVVVGSGPEEASLRATAKVLNIQEKTLFVPSTSAVADWLRSMDIFVLPSRSESFPNALLEGMACGCAVVASRVGGVPELVDHREDGLLFESGDAIALSQNLTLLTRDSVLRRKLATRASQKAVERFTMLEYSRRIERFYVEQLQRG